MEELKKECARVYRSAVRAGVLIKGPCNVCGTTVKIEGHHEDHKKPLEVIWLCKSHHGKLGSEQARVSPNRWKQLEGCRKAGRKNVLTGHIYTISTSETCAKAGRISGKKNVETGHIYRISEKNRGRKHSIESRQKMSEALKVAWARRKNK